MSEGKAKRPTLKEIMFRSTIYNRHEARRAKTLLNKDDTRPALLRVLAPRTPSAATRRSKAPSVESYVQPVMIQEESVFTLHDTPNANAATLPRQSSVATSVMASIFGAVFSEAVYGARCLSAASPFASSRIAVVGPPQVVVHPEYATLMMQQQSMLSAPQARPGFFQGLSHAQLASRAAPVAVLFGVKSSMEHLLTSDTNKAPPAAISILSAAAAGGFLGGLRSVIPSRLSSTGLSVMGREMTGATLYFTAYDGVKHILVNKQDRAALNPLATILAGALAGVVYDTVRYLGQYAVDAPLAPTQSRSIATLVLRSAPSHALLFLGYESMLRATRP